MSAEAAFELLREKGCTQLRSVPQLTHRGVSGCEALCAGGATDSRATRAILQCLFPAIGLTDGRQTDRQTRDDEEVDRRYLFRKYRFNVKRNSFVSVAIIVTAFIWQI